MTVPYHVQVARDKAAAIAAIQARIDAIDWKSVPPVGLAELLVYRQTGYDWGECRLTVGPRGRLQIHCVEVRHNGRVQTWKTRPTDYSAPFKYGLRECFRVTPTNNELHDRRFCPVRKLFNELLREREGE